MKSILVTGISRGLGLEIAKNLLDQGYKIYGISRSINNDVEDLINRYKDSFKFKMIDLKDSEKIIDELKEFIPVKEPIYGFVNNAAIAYDDIITNLNHEKLVDMYNVNVFSPLMITKFVIRNMILNNVKAIMPSMNCQILKGKR